MSRWKRPTHIYVFKCDARLELFYTILARSSGQFTATVLVLTSDCQRTKKVDFIPIKSENLDDSMTPIKKSCTVTFSQMSMSASIVSRFKMELCVRPIINYAHRQCRIYNLSNIEWRRPTDGRLKNVLPNKSGVS